jgi:hypothetical protein
MPNGVKLQKQLHALIPVVRNGMTGIQMLHTVNELPSERAFVFKVLVKTDFSKVNLDALLGQSSEKYFTATRFPSESSSKMFFTEGQDACVNVMYRYR